MTIRRLLRRRSVVLMALLAASLLGAWLWLRDSTLVQVKHVTITGVSGPDAVKIRSALTTAARNMTTLDVHMDQLRTAAGPFPVVKDLQVDTQFPHGVRIHVVEEVPVATVTVAGHATAVAGDGTLLRDMRPSQQLPLVSVAAPPGGARLSQPDALHAVTLLGAAPYQLLGHIEKVTTQPQHGLVAQLRGGLSVYFGDASRFAAKWLAADAVLADPGSAGAAYLDVTDPERPVAGGGSGAGAGSLASGQGGASGSGQGGTSGSGQGGTSGSGVSANSGGGSGAQLATGAP